MGLEGEAVREKQELATRTKEGFICKETFTKKTGRISKRCRRQVTQPPMK